MSLIENVAKGMDAAARRRDRYESAVKACAAAVCALVVLYGCQARRTTALADRASLLEMDVHELEIHVIMLEDEVRKSKEVEYLSCVGPDFCPDFYVERPEWFGPLEAPK